MMRSRDGPLVSNSFLTEMRHNARGGLKIKNYQKRAAKRGCLSVRLQGLFHVFPFRMLLLFCGWMRA